MSFLQSRRLDCMTPSSNTAHNPYASNLNMFTLPNLGARVIMEAENIKALERSMTMKLNSYLDPIGGLQKKVEEMEKRLDVLEKKKKNDKEEAKKDGFELVNSEEDIEDREGPEGDGKGKRTPYLVRADFGFDVTCFMSMQATPTAYTNNFTCSHTYATYAQNYIALNRHLIHGCRDGGGACACEAEFRKARIASRCFDVFTLRLRREIGLHFDAQSDCSTLALQHPNPPAAGHISCARFAGRSAAGVLLRLGRLCCSVGGFVELRGRAPS